MKFGADMTRRCAEWVRVNGLMECGGASLKDFCDAMGITKETYYKWLEKSDFSDRIKKAQDEFADNAVVELTQTLFEIARGGKPYEKRRTHKEYLPSDKKGMSGKLSKMTEDIETGVTQPNLGAAIFILTNRDPEHWCNPQRVSIDGKLATDIELRPLTDEEVERVKASWKSREKKEGGR